MTSWLKTLLLVASLFSTSNGADLLKSEFALPPRDARPETWFHLIGGNVSKPGLTADLEAVARAGLSGIQLFHGSGRPWPGVSPQIQALSPPWDGMIEHVADETRRLGLRFTMQNCPGWAMSGGPWITPVRAMRHLIWSRTDIAGGAKVSLDLAQPQPSQEVWRDYRDVTVIAFPTPKDDVVPLLRPVSHRSNRPDHPWSELFTSVPGTKTRIVLKPEKDPVWLEVIFAQPVTLRSVELPPIEFTSMRRIFDPQVSIRVQAITPNGLVDVATRDLPRASWQDKDWDERPWVMALADMPAIGYRFTFNHRFPMELRYLRLSTAARVHDWHGQAGYVLRSHDFSPPPVQDPTTWVRADSVVDLHEHLDGTGKLIWTAPAGNWTILRFGHVNTGVKNKPAPPEATGFECDKLSPLGAEQHFAGYIGRLTNPGGPADGGRLQGMVIDSWECFTQSWTPAMAGEFATRRSYALTTFFPALAGWVVDNHVTSQRFLRDWRATISDLIVDNYYGRLATLARARGMTLSFESSTGDVAVGDLLEYYGRADIPMCEFWQPNDPHWGGLEQKPIAPAASAAHIYGKPRIAAEAFTNVNLRWDEHPFMLKHLADFHFTEGVNHLVFHTTTHNPRLDLVPGTSFGGRIGTPFVRNQTWWPQLPLFTDYLARCAVMLQRGQPVADVLWYLGDTVDHRPRSDSAFPSGYKFDYLNADALINRLSVTNGILHNPEGTSWKVLWLRPENCRNLTLPTLRRLRGLLQKGATLIGPAPQANATLTGGAEADRQFSAIVSELWGESRPTKGDRRVGAGRLVWGTSLDESLRALEIVPDVSGASSASWCHRVDQETDIYFVAAGRQHPLQANLRFRASGIPEFWDPLTGRSRSAGVYHRDGEGTTVALDLPPAGSVFVVFRPGQSTPSVNQLMHDGTVLADATDSTRVDRGPPHSFQGLKPGELVQPWVDHPDTAAEIIDHGQRLLAWEKGVYTIARSDQSAITVNATESRSITVTSPWTLSFPSGWDAPTMVNLPALKPWSALEDPATRAFSGTVTYRCTLQLESTAADTPMRLDLGRVAVIAAVSINGKLAGTLWGPPFRLDVTPYLVAGPNQIEVQVTNSWYNRLAYDASLPEAKRRTWTINGPAATAPLIDAGLTGPVSLRIGQILDLSRPNPAVVK